MSTRHTWLSEVIMPVTRWMEMVVIERTDLCPHCTPVVREIGPDVDDDGDIW